MNCDSESRVLTSNKPRRHSAMCLQYVDVDDVIGEWDVWRYMLPYTPKTENIPLFKFMLLACVAALGARRQDFIRCWRLALFGGGCCLSLNQRFQTHRVGPFYDSTLLIKTPAAECVVCAMRGNEFRLLIWNSAYWLCKHIFTPVRLKLLRCRFHVCYFRSCLRKDVVCCVEMVEPCSSEYETEEATRHRPSCSQRCDFLNQHYRVWGGKDTDWIRSVGK
jgi:hypothetical protein